MTPMAAPTCGPKVIAVNAPRSHPEDGQAGNGHEPAAARRAHPERDDDPDDEPEDQAEQHADDQRADARLDRERRPVADQGVQLVGQVQRRT